MTGLIWFVQIVHYPLFHTVHRLNECPEKYPAQYPENRPDGRFANPAIFSRYVARHASRTTWVVFPAMALEIATALAGLSSRLRPGFLTRPEAIASAVLVVLIWASTGLIQVPLHDRLARAPDHGTIDRLVASNWIRVALWTARSVLLSLVLWNLLAT